MITSYFSAQYPATEIVRIFSGAIWAPEDLIEIRSLPSGSSRWLPASQIHTIATALELENDAGQNIYAGVNPRSRHGRTNADVNCARCIFADFDNTTVEEARNRICAARLPEPTILVASGHGAHAYWIFTVAIEELETWRDLQRDLAALLSSDPLHDPARILRLPGFLNHKDPPAPCELVSCDSQRRYSLDELRQQIPRRAERPSVPIPTGNEDSDIIIPEERRNQTLASLAGSMVHRGMSHAAILAALTAENEARCRPPLPVEEVLSIANSVARYTDDADTDTPEYERTDEGVAWWKPGRHGAILVPLTNFDAVIVADNFRDDGSGDIVRAYDVRTVVGGRQVTSSVHAADFGAMLWPAQKLGAEAVVYPGLGLRDRARAAIQLTSPRPIPQIHIYTHTGWRELPSGWAYLHAGGAIGNEGQIPSVRVELHDSLSRFVLPAPPTGSELVQCIRATLRLLRLAPMEIMLPLFASIWRSVLAPSDFTIHLAGPTGVFKSEVAALIQQHFGREFDSRHLPTGWHSTDNAIEGLLFCAKDAIVVVDDFAPCGSQYDVARYHQRRSRNSRTR